MVDRAWVKIFWSNFSRAKGDSSIDDDPQIPEACATFWLGVLKRVKGEEIAKASKKGNFLHLPCSLFLFSLSLCSIRVLCVFQVNLPMPFRRVGCPHLLPQNRSLSSSFPCSESPCQFNLETMDQDFSLRGTTRKTEEERKEESKDKRRRRSPCAHLGWVILLCF